MNKVFEIVRDMSIDRFKSHMRFEDISIMDTEDSKVNRIRSFHTAIILISGHNLKITFKVHFTSEIAAYLTSHALNKDIEKICRGN